MRRSAGSRPAPDDAPAEGVVAQAHQVVGVARHMGAMKAAQAEVHDPRGDAGRIEAGQPHWRAQAGEVGTIERDGLHDIPPDHQAISVACDEHTHTQPAFHAEPSDAVRQFRGG